MATKTTSTGTSGQGNGHKKDNLLEKFFLDQLKDIYYAEQQLLKTMKTHSLISFLFSDLAFSFHLVLFLFSLAPLLLLSWLLKDQLLLLVCGS